eukprot:scaffold206343_cov21-Tisochrysis_lutea.AAC.1
MTNTRARKSLISLAAGWHSHSCGCQWQNGPNAHHFHAVEVLLRAPRQCSRRCEGQENEGAVGLLGQACDLRLAPCLVPFMHVSYHDGPVTVMRLFFLMCAPTYACQVLCSRWRQPREIT